MKMTAEQKALLEDLHYSRNEDWDVDLYTKTIKEKYNLSDEEALGVVREFGASETAKKLNSMSYNFD